MPDGSDRPRRVCDVPWRHLMTQQFHDQIWPQIAPFLGAALKRDPLHRYTLQDVLQEIMTGRVRLWISYDATKQEFEMATLTQITKYPQACECRIWLIGGRNMKAWKEECIETIESYARAEGCSHMTATGPLAWTRLAGCRAPSYDLVKEL